MNSILNLKIGCCLLALVLVSCGGTKTPKQAEVRRTNTITNIVNYSKTYLGTPYKYGGMSPSGMDCSGLLHLAYMRYGVQVPRTALDMSKTGSRLSLKQIDVGDLVFFKTSKSSRTINHVGMVVHKTAKAIDFIHSSSSRGVMISSMNNPYWKKNYVKSRRVNF